MDQPCTVIAIKIQLDCQIGHLAIPKMIIICNMMPSAVKLQHVVIVDFVLISTEVQQGNDSI